MSHQVVLCKILLKSRNLNERTTFEDGISVIFLKKCEKKACKFRKIAVGLEARNRVLSSLGQQQACAVAEQLMEDTFEACVRREKTETRSGASGRPQERCVLMIKDRFNQNVRRFQIRVSPTDRN